MQERLALAGDESPWHTRAKSMARGDSEARHCLTVASAASNASPLHAGLGSAARCWPSLSEAPRGRCAARCPGPFVVSRARTGKRAAARAPLSRTLRERRGTENAAMRKLA